ncbi:MAG: D-alanyl-D-alanine carboxypeptidase [bacterium]|nr:D-alanyl-D-alanine carboxypeptidase [bacterium]
MKILANNKKKSLATLILLLSFGFIFSLSAFSNSGGEGGKPAARAEQKSPLVFDAPFKNISLEAKSAIVFDLASGKAIFELNPSSQLPLASLTKIMTAVVVEEKFPKWMKVEIPLAAIMQEGDSGLSAGELWKIGDLARAMLISSSNDAAFAFASAFNSVAGRTENPASAADFVALMNRKARELNLSQTYFLNPTGLDESEGVAGAYGSAEDVANLLAFAFKKYPSIFGVTRKEFFDAGNIRFKNTNKLVDEVPLIVAGKTGFSALAGGNLAIIVDVGLGNPVAIAALGSSEEGRFNDVKTLYEETLRYFQYK